MNPSVYAPKALLMDPPLLFTFLFITAGINLRIYSRDHDNRTIMRYIYPC